MPICPGCGHEVGEKANFCANCGASLRSRAIDRMIEDARRALDDNPNDTSARYNLALAYKLGGMNELALREFIRVAELQPDFADVHYEIGQLQAEANLIDEAITALERALSIDPDHTRAQRALSLLRRRS